MERRHIFGKGFQLTEEQKTRAEGYLGKRAKKDSHAAGEKEKSHLEKLYSELADSYFLQDLDELGLAVPATPEFERVHIMPTKASFGRKVGKRLAHALGVYTNDHIYLHQKRVFKRHPVESFGVFLHERIHAGSHTSFAIRKDRLGRARSPKLMRVGYDTAGLPKRIAYRIFEGLNEAVTEEWTQELIRKHKSDLMQKLNIRHKNLNDLSMGMSANRAGIWEAKNDIIYVQVRNVLAHIIERISDATAVPREEVWKRFKLGMVTGEMMHLRDIDHAFGTRSLALLAQLTEFPMDTKAEHNPSLWDRKYLIIEYFCDADAARRKDIRALLLGNEKTTDFESIYDQRVRGN